MFKDKINIILVICLILGISLLSYPSIADFWNASRSTKIISEYGENLEKLDKKKIEIELEKAREYNEKLTFKQHFSDMTAEELKKYNSILKTGATDVMATLEIPSINLRLPIYHGSKENVLQSATGHIEWTSLPVGGKGTHAVITGHRGLVSARLFTDIDQLELGDIFNIRVFNEKLSYKVDDISIVEPHEINNLLIDKNKDYVTLLTCTPYGINTHRLLVRGIRIDGLEDIEVSSEAVRIRPVLVASIMIVPSALILGLLILCMDRLRRKRR